jgi:hypothetical protein
MKKLLLGALFLNVCLAVAVPVALEAQNRFEIVEVVPTQATTGDEIMVLLRPAPGTSFDPDPDDLCILIRGRGTDAVPLRALEVLPPDPTREVVPVRAVVGAVPEGAQPGPILVTPGQGSSGNTDPGPCDSAHEN